MNWTQEKPQVRGFYFYKKVRFGFCYILEIEQSNNPKERLLVYRGDEKDGKARDDYPGWWAGPIPTNPPPN